MAINATAIGFPTLFSNLLHSCHCLVAQQQLLPTQLLLHRNRQSVDCSIFYRWFLPRQRHHCCRGRSTNQLATTDVQTVVVLASVQQSTGGFIKAWKWRWQHRCNSNQNKGASMNWRPQSTGDDCWCRNSVALANGGSAASGAMNQQ